ncbi:hypothetical protein K439DRAFT_767188 [Ramaria rubella]|nr:hypothetical protein K439DRAFT_767188 [Ramaria rubella]
MRFSCPLPSSKFLFVRSYIWNKPLLAPHFYSAIMILSIMMLMRWPGISNLVAVSCTAPSPHLSTYSWLACYAPKHLFQAIPRYDHPSSTGSPLLLAYVQLKCNTRKPPVG